MTSFLFVRHGETVGFKAGQFTGGGTDTPLTPEGLLQTELFIRKLRKTESSLDACITSTLQRTKAFGVFYKEYFDGLTFSDPRLNEKHAGVFEGCSGNDFKTLGWENKYFDRWFNGLPCGESYYEVVVRVIESLKFWEQEFPDGRVLVGSHADVIRPLEVIQRKILKSKGRFVLKKNVDLSEFYRESLYKDSPPSYPTDSQLSFPVPYFYILEVDLDLFQVRN